LKDEDEFCPIAVLVSLLLFTTELRLKHYLKYFVLEMYHYEITRDLDQDRFKRMIGEINKELKVKK